MSAVPRELNSKDSCYFRRRSPYFALRGISRAVEFNARHYVLRQTPTLVYYMERTGGTALAYSLADAHQFVITSHCLNPAQIAGGRVPGSAAWAIKHILHPGKPVKLISMVRNPVDVLISKFARDRYDAEVRKRGIGSTRGESLEDVDLSRALLEEVRTTDRLLRHLNWFETEFRRSTGIDIHRHFFDKELGYGVAREGAYKALILRTEMEDDRKVELVSNFLGIAPFPMRGPHEVQNWRHRAAPGTPGATSPYRKAYSAFQRELSIPDDIWAKIVALPYAKTFFTRAQLEKARSRLAGSKSPTLSELSGSSTPLTSKAS